MNKNIIIYLLIIIFSIAKATEFGKFIRFTHDYNNVFYFTFEEEGNFFVQVDYPLLRDTVSLKIEVKNDCGWSVYSQNTGINPPGNGFVIPFKKEYKVILRLSYKMKTGISPGYIWMLPSMNEIKVDLKQKYEWKYDYIETLSNNQTSELTFSIDNAEEDKVLEFYFNDNLNIYQNSKAPNPLKIFHNNYYIIGGTYFQIRKGESYKIIISESYWDLKTKSASYIHYLPHFFFYFTENDPENVFEFGKTKQFDENKNTKFDFNFTEDGSLFVEADFPKSDLVTLVIISYDESVSESISINPPGISTVVPFKKGNLVKVRLSYKSSSNEKGTIWMNPSIAEIKVDLGQKYEWKYDFQKKLELDINFCLTFAIDNAEENAIFNYIHYSKFKVQDIMEAKDPLRIYHNNYYRAGVTSFQITKGESYKIEACTDYWSNGDHYYYLSSFSFDFKKNMTKQDP